MRTQLIPMVAALLGVTSIASAQPNRAPRAAEVATVIPQNFASIAGGVRDVPQAFATVAGGVKDVPERFAVARTAGAKTVAARARPKHVK